MIGQYITVLRMIGQSKDKLAEIIPLLDVVRY
jgi:hypothetical protein